VGDEDKRTVYFEGNEYRVPVGFFTHNQSVDELRAALAQFIVKGNDNAGDNHPQCKPE